MDFSTWDFDAFDAFDAADWQSPTAEKTEFGCFEMNDIPIDPRLLSAEDLQLSATGASALDSIPTHPESSSSSITSFAPVISGQVPAVTTQATTADAFKAGFNGDETLGSTELPQQPVASRIPVPSQPMAFASSFPGAQSAYNVAQAHTQPQYIQGYAPLPYQQPAMPHQYMVPSVPVHYVDAYPQQQFIVPQQYVAARFPVHQAQTQVVKTNPKVNSPTHLKPTHGKKRPTRGRRNKYNVEGLYEPLPAAPQRQGPVDEAGEDFIEYDAYGEFFPHERRFTQAEFRQYLWWTKEHVGEPDVRWPTLWIQAHPAMSNERYPRQSASFKCRMERCPVRNGTILKGMWQVGIDEFSEQTGEQRDPFHMAGHCHLWCLEREFDLFELHEQADVRPDCREFRKEGGRNPMSLRRDGSSWSAYKKWYWDQKALYEEHCKRYPDPAERPRRAPRVKDCLWHWLTQAKLDNEAPAKETARLRREAEAVECADLNIYKGDLAVYARLIERRNQKKRLARVPDSDNERWVPDSGFLQHPTSAASQVRGQKVYIDPAGQPFVMVPHHMMPPFANGKGLEMMQAQAPVDDFNPNLCSLPGQGQLALYPGQAQTTLGLEDNNAGFAPVAEMNYIDVQPLPATEHQQQATPTMALLNSSFPTADAMDGIEPAPTPRLRRSLRLERASTSGHEGRSRRPSSASLFSCASSSRTKRGRAESQDEDKEPRSKRTKV